MEHTERIVSQYISGEVMKIQLQFPADALISAAIKYSDNYEGAEKLAPEHTVLSNLYSSDFEIVGFCACFKEKTCPSEFHRLTIREAELRNITENFTDALFEGQKTSVSFKPPDYENERAIVQISCADAKELPWTILYSDLRQQLSKAAIVISYNKTPEIELLFKRVGVDLWGLREEDTRLVVDESLLPNKKALFRYAYVEAARSDPAPVKDKDIKEALEKWTSSKLPEGTDVSRNLTTVVGLLKEICIEFTHPNALALVEGFFDLRLPPPLPSAPTDYWHLKERRQNQKTVCRR